MNSGHKYVQLLEERAVLLTDLKTIGSALVLAPHPDDESLGCGGTIALLREKGYAVHVLFVSDGTMSHPNSNAYPASRLRDLREQEAREALRRLHVDADACTFLRYPDRRVPTSHNLGFPEAVTRVAALLDEVRPTTVFMPWQRDPHPDHRACWQMGMAAVDQSHEKPRILEYLIWLWELGTPDDLPTPDERTVWQVNIESVMDQRNQAIAAHQSQVTRLIDDDPTAFYLSPELLRHFEPPRELFLEATDF
jgi:LmbE family N-acetylglucosaminyl deacetylase